MSKSDILVLILTLIVILLLVYTFNVYDTYQNYSKRIGSNLKINLAEARSRRFGFIIDVRTPKERRLLGYYPNSVPIPLETLSQEVPLDISNKNTWILVYSNGDNRAAIAAEILYKRGYKNVRYINETYLSLLPGS